MKKNFIIKYGYRWASATDVPVYCTENEVEAVAWAIYRGWKGDGFCVILNEDGTLYYTVDDCM